MRILKYLLILCSIAFAYTSCNDDDDETEDTIAQIQENKELCEQYLLDKKNSGEVYEDPSGLLYEYIHSTNGEKPNATDTVTISYKGYLVDDRQFIEKTETTAMEDLPQGMYIGLRHTNEGATIKIYAPYYLMYGTSKKSVTFDDEKLTILEYSALVYEITLDSITFVNTKE